MKNEVVKVLNAEHGKAVINYFKALGVDTRGLKGCITEDEGYINVYYGVIDDYFDSYPLGEVNIAKAKITTFATPVHPNDNDFIISVKHAQSIIDIACDGWKQRLADAWGSRMVMRLGVIITQDEYKEMHAACTSEQLDLFETIFGPYCGFKKGDWVTTISQAAGKHKPNIGETFQITGLNKYACLFKESCGVSFKRLRLATPEEIATALILNVKSLNLSDFYYHTKIYNGNERMKLVGIRISKSNNYEVELEGDYSGGTHAVCQRDWHPLEGLRLNKSNNL